MPNAYFNQRNKDKPCREDRAVPPTIELANGVRAYASLISIRYRFFVENSEYDVVAVGRGAAREVRVVDLANKVLWYAPFFGTLNSNRARIALGAFMKGRR